MAAGHMHEYAQLEGKGDDAALQYRRIICCSTLVAGVLLYGVATGGFAPAVVNEPSRAESLVALRGAWSLPAATRSFQPGLIASGPQTSQHPSVKANGWFKSPFASDSDEAREASFQAQQEMLKMRRSKEGTKAYMDKVNKKRQDLAERARAKRIWSKDGKDNLRQWREIQKDKRYDQGFSDYADEPKGFSIPLPVAPWGIPKYDNGERFDLRLPYVDQGWVEDPLETEEAAKKEKKNKPWWR